MDLAKYVTIGEDGKLVIDNDAFTAEYDRETRKAMDTYTANNAKKIEADVRKKLEEEAKLTAEERLKQDREAFAKEMADARRELAQSKAKAKLENANIFDKDEIETYLELVSTDDNLEKIDKLITARTKANETYEKTIKEKIIGSTPTPTSGTDNGTSNDLGALMARQYQSRSTAGNCEKSAFSDLM